MPESIEEYDAFLASAVNKYGKLSEQLGGLVAEQVGRSKLHSPLAWHV